VSRRNPRFPVGIDYYPIDAENRSWDDWYDKDMEADLAAFGEAGLSLVRVFVSWKFFEQQVGQYEAEADARLDRLVAAARRSGLRLLVDFFADDQLAQLTEVTWRGTRDPRTDDYMIQREIALVQRLVNRLRSEQVVFGWELCNEAFAAGFETEQALEAWVARLREAIREVDGDRPIVLGVDPETLFVTSGVDAGGALDTCELAVSHVTAPYRVFAAEGPITSGPATYLPGFLLRAARRDLPVLADGIGTFSLDHSLAEEAAYTRMSLYSAVMNGAAGAMLRRYRDVDTERREPYFRDPYEVLVGIADSDARPKRAMHEVAAFVRVVEHLDLSRWKPVPERVAVVVPQERFEPLPSLAGLFDPRSCLQAYVSAKEAHLPVDVIREEDGFGSYLTLVVPSVATLEDSTWGRLAEFVQSGGSLVVTYGGGDAHPATRDLFGIEFLGDSGPRDSLGCRVAQPGVVGEIESFDAALAVPHFALLGQGRATVVATDESGSPLLTVNQSGQGKAVYCAAPLERALAQGDPWVAPAPVRHLLRTVYGAVASGSGAGGPVSCDRPEVEVAGFTGEDDGALLLLNHANEKVVAQVSVDRPVVSVSDLRGGSATPVGGYTLGVNLTANGSAALRIDFSEATESAGDSRETEE
jgi:endo-1,4-beta-mannosidase